MHSKLMYAAYGWLTLGGGLHLGVDVVSQYLRHKRAPGPETTLYYGLNTAYAMGQIFYGVLGLILIHEALPLVRSWPVVTLTWVAFAAWMAFCFAFVEYREPRFVLGLFGLLYLAALLVPNV